MLAENVKTEVMFLWTIDVEGRWDYEEEFFGWSKTYTVMAPDYDSALSKAKEFALWSAEFVDDDPDEGDGLTHKLAEVRPTAVNRGKEIDAW